jgi:hypothetical protein
MILAPTAATGLPVPGGSDLFNLESNSEAYHSGAKELESIPAAAPKTRQSVHSADYSEKSQGNDGDEKKKNAKKPKVKSTKKLPPKKPSGGTTNVDENAVPNPAPDGGTTKTSVTAYHTGGIYSGVLPVVQASSTQSVASTSGFSPLPPLAAFATSRTPIIIATSSGPSSIPSPATTLHNQGVSKLPPGKHLPTVSIVLLVIGGVLVAVGLFAVFKVCCRPRKRTYPTPSRPILQDPFQDEPKCDPDEESLFGGKERTSTQGGGNEVLLNWTQYPHTSVMKPLPTLDIHAPQPDNAPKRSSREMAEENVLSFSGGGLLSGNNLGTRSPGRLSAISASIYPLSPVPSFGGQGIGIAVSGSPLTADNMPLLQRSKSSGASARRLSVAGRVGVRHSVIPSTYGTSDLYGGFASPMPVTPKPAAASNTNAQGRARVKAPYAPGSFLRTSAAATPAPNFAVRDSNPFEEPQYVLPPISPVMKTDDHRERDTRALTSALGLASPAPVPPSPDDSITLASDRRRSRNQILSPVVDANTRLGKLMMGDFHSIASLPSVRGVAAATSTPANGAVRAKQPIPRKRVEEKPPRVPSPPPMPSLAQMALQHNNPQDFESYRSPTYSIYGLYDPDRKSRAPGEGGY